MHVAQRASALAFSCKSAARANHWFGLAGSRSFHSDTFVCLDGSNRVGVVVDRSRSGKTFLVEIGGEQEHHPFETLRLWKPQEARVFINGDAMPKEATFQWLEHLCRDHADVLIWKAVGTHCESQINKTAKKFEALPGISADNVRIVKARSGVQNAADALLSALYGRHAKTEAMNYVLSDDKKWFSELPHVFCDMPTVWLTFKGLTTSHSNQSWRPAYWPPCWTTGTYVATHEVLIQAGFRLKSSVIGSLAVGERLEVKEIARVEKDGRIRGRIAALGCSGWVSLMNIQDRHVWALPCCL